MPIDQTITSRDTKINNLLSEFAQFWNEPLDKALIIFKGMGWTDQRIADEIFNGEASRQAVSLRIQKIKKGGEK